MRIVPADAAAILGPRRVTSSGTKATVNSGGSIP